MFTESHIMYAHATHQHEYHLQGNWAQFLPLTDKWGYKYFHRESLADRNYKNQQIAFEAGLGPELGDRLDTPLGYGYITERVDPVSKSHSSFISNEFQQELRQLGQKLCELFDLWSVPDFDMSSLNAGYKDGKLIGIDFSLAR